MWRYPRLRDWDNPDHKSDQIIEQTQKSASLTKKPLIIGTAIIVILIVYVFSLSINSLPLMIISIFFVTIIVIAHYRLIKEIK
jgi:hypothetical protein